ncbi:hypothetical protein EHQ12_04345 [Leptospira gomenensis]|uniref:Uncharacterized protein n=1 Tax=Leptospira gomenensis TaxID=2484974 RepID=A0A5F1YFD0_9LEPT|nr:hypothetical protein [Leptospira gomenensis]TGK38607.1 hypothetical protein EHQ17_00775 [Leptospira gomenensis]TGK42844.1 hypothetical protein EHQ12_04345 [Leptospira gomenensis]TGK49611.1 hypothetical protein EHQ07_04830 [Leptospira gomenensis]TGK60719.1 hypothetical protein EHQ13_10240 [Leptospira gomenensis]
MRKELSEKIKFPKTEHSLLPKHSKRISYADAIAAVRLVSMPREKFSKQIVFASLVGALRGFQERELKPFHSNHRIVFSELSSEIFKVVPIPSSSASLNYEERIRFLKEAFEYGIRKVYHLEWKLYTSREIY